METFLYILLILACFILIAACLLQPAKSGAMSPLGGSSQSVFGSTGGTTFLFRLTMWTAAFIMAVCVILSRWKVQEGKMSVIDAAPVTTPSNPTMPPPGAKVPTAPAPGATNAPSTETPAGAPTSTPQTPGVDASGAPKTTTAPEVTTKGVAPIQAPTPTPGPSNQPSH